MDPEDLSLERNKGKTAVPSVIGVGCLIKSECIKFYIFSTPQTLVLLMTSSFLEISCFRYFTYFQKTICNAVFAILSKAHVKSKNDFSNRFVTKRLPLFE